jgi:RNA polymerase sigma-32 factor
MSREPDTIAPAKKNKRKPAEPAEATAETMADAEDESGEISPDEVDDLDLDLDDDDSDDEEHEADASSANQGVLIDPTTAPIPAPTVDSLALSGGDTLTRYMTQLRVHPPITREEEQKLARRWVEDGDVEAARRLVVSNLRLVVKIAMEYRRAWTNTLDLIQEGNVGLMEAVQRFDPYQGVKLSTYAVYWIRAYILKYIMDNMRSIRMGTTRAQRKLFYRLNKERRELERQGYEVTPKLIAERLEVSEKDVWEMQSRLSRPDQSMDAPVRDEAGSATFGDFVSSNVESAETQVGDAELREVFHEHINAFKSQLGERDLQILEERVLADEPRTLADMGEEFGVTRERVRQLEARIVNKLREYMKTELVDFEYYAPDSDS